MRQYIYTDTDNEGKLLVDDLVFIQEGEEGVKRLIDIKELTLENVNDKVQIKDKNSFQNQPQILISLKKKVWFLLFPLVCAL